MVNLLRRALVCAVGVGCVAGSACAVRVTPTRMCVTPSIPFQILTRMRNPIVRQGFGTWLMITEDMPDGRICYYFDYASRSRANLKTPQPGNWVPLGSAIKWLMYVDQYQGLSRLMAHDVDWHADHIALSNSQNQIGCGFAGTDCYYGQYRAARVGDHYPVDIYRLHLTNGMYEPVCVSDSEKTDFAHDGNLMVYRAHYGPGDDRICGQYFSGGSEFVIAYTNAIHPTVCGPLVAWAEPAGAAYRILAKSLDTGEIRTIAYTKANPPCPEAGRGAIFWQDARDPKTGLDIYGYDWATKKEFAVTKASGNQVRLRVCDNLVTYVSGAPNFEILWGVKVE